MYLRTKQLSISVLVGQGESSVLLPWIQRQLLINYNAFSIYWLEYLKCFTYITPYPHNNHVCVGFVLMLQKKPLD